MNREIIEILSKWKSESGVPTIIQFKMSYSTGILKIYTSYPAYMFGKAGCYANYYTDILKKEISGFKSIELIEVDRYIIN